MSKLNVEELYNNAKDGDVLSISRLLSLIESESECLEGFDEEIYLRQPSGHFAGITGAPGAGKSTLTSALVASYRSHGEKVAVLAVDPSSPFSGGAILGDRVRMSKHALDEGVYVRSLASRGYLGGLSKAVPRAAKLLSVLGFETVLIETVGVGQSEIDLMEAVDSVIVVVNPGWGDSVQTAKAGLLEIGDIFVVNKADRPNVNETIRDLEQMLKLGSFKPFNIPILKTVATTSEGIEELYKAIKNHFESLISSGLYFKRRKEQLIIEFKKAAEDEVKKRFLEKFQNNEFDAVIKEITEGKITPYFAAKKVLKGLGFGDQS